MIIHENAYFANFIMEGEETNTILWHRMELDSISIALQPLSFEANLIRRIYIFFLNSNTSLNKEAEVTCEMGLKSTHLI